ncbi:MAG: VPLPA-CTERM sorting domain-containing protein [Proteobacteria bacterium]|nr:VPLPA-CTERM sorting domain-containing protein [Pseudomonadota bacterium]
MRNRPGTTFVCIAAALTICLALTGTASAELLWNQPQGGWGAYIDNTNWNAWIADDFKLVTAAKINQAGWAGGAGGANDPISPSGFYVRFYDNYYDDALGHNRPADSPAYQVYIPIGSIASSQIGESGYFNYSANLPVSFAAAANTHYWFSVQADTIRIDQPWWGWLPADTQNIGPGELNFDSYVHYPVNQPPFSGYDYDFTYSLSGSAVPLPGAVWFLAPGFLGLAGWRRFKKS